VFVEVVVESKLSAHQYNCETQKERCQYTCQNTNDDQASEYQCYTNSVLSYCDNQVQNKNRNRNWYQKFDLQEAVNCKRLEIDKGALQYYMYSSGGRNQYQYFGKEMGLYVGPYCSVNGKKIMLGMPALLFRRLYKVFCFAASQFYSGDTHFRCFHG
jgi:hypothetical protein